LDHSDEKLKYWCKQCEVLVCRDCLLFQHKDHTFSSLKEAASEAKTKFQQTAQEIEEIKRNLTTFSETTKNIIDERHERVRQGKQNIEQTFANLQRILEERKRTITKQLDDNELETMKILDQHQNTINQHLNLTTVQELCIKKMLDSDDPIQILKFKSTLSHNYKDYTEQYKKIDEGYTIKSQTFEKEDKDVEEIVKKIETLGNIISKSHAVKRVGIDMEWSNLDVSKANGITELISKKDNRARGYKFTLKKSLKLRSIQIHSDQVGQIIGFVVNDAGIIVQKGTMNSTNATMKWLRIPLECDIQNQYSVLVITPSDNGSYTYKKGDSELRIINQNCSVKSKCVDLVSQMNVGTKVSFLNSASSLDMILDVADK
jgi:ribosome-binding protein aMBF1 (putative translation factor)